MSDHVVRGWPGLVRSSQPVTHPPTREALEAPPPPPRLLLVLLLLTGPLPLPLPLPLVLALLLVVGPALHEEKHSQRLSPLRNEALCASHKVCTVPGGLHTWQPAHLPMLQGSMRSLGCLVCARQTGPV